MKIAYIIGNFPVLSETFVLNEIVRLQDLGCEVDVYAFKRPSEEDIAKLSARGAELYAQTKYIGLSDVLRTSLGGFVRAAKAWKDNRYFQEHANGSPNSLMRLLRAICISRHLDKQGYDAVHAHWPYASQIAHLISVMSNRSYSISVHAHEVAHEGGHFPLVLKSMRFASFCNSGALGYLKKTMDFDFSSKAHLIYHGVDIKGFDYVDLPPVKDELRVVSAGRLTPTKGFDKLVKACALARARGIPVKLTILGRGEEFESLQAIAQEQNFKEHLTMPGWVAQSDVHQYLCDSHIFALLANTGFHDGLPNVALEAMATGRPAILSPLPAAREAVEDGREGFILESEQDLEGFITCLKRIVEEEGLLQRLSVAARERVVKDHDADMQILAMLDLFNASI